MKVYDLISGQKVDLPSSGIASGRYRLTQDCVFNEEIKLLRGDILWRLGDGLISLAPEEQPDFRFSGRFGMAPGQAAAHRVVSLSIAAVVDSWSVEAEASRLPSPLLPSVLRDRMELMDPEPELERALATGQWDEISARPRLDMHYVPETLPVARAKRVQASAVEHLSQHSELWARRTISGVVPAKVLARVSEDDYGIYENVVFARLLDSCANWLNGRISDIRDIVDGQSMALKLEKSDEKHRLLRDRVCSLWGKAWFSEAKDSHGTSETLERLEKMRSNVERLRRTGVYRRVPRSAKVPLKLRPTNIFQYDKRYRELRPLWDALASASIKDQVSDSERYQSLAARQVAFHRYVLLLLCHALRDMGAARGGITELHYRVGPWDVRIDTEDIGEVRIRVLACGKLLRTRTLVLLLSKEDEAVCHDPNRSLFYAEDLAAVGSITDDDQDPRVLNPFRFFGVERIRQALERDLADIFLAEYPARVLRVPSSVCSRLSGAAGDIFKQHGDGLLVVPSSRLPAPDLEKLVTDACPGHQETKAHLRYAIGLGQWLVKCRACGVRASADAMSADERALRLVCPSCRLETTVKTSPTRNMRSAFQGERHGFEFCGGVEIDLPATGKVSDAVPSGWRAR